MMNVMPLTDYKEIIQHCFSQDQDLLGKWHIRAGQGLKKCVEQTFDDMTKADVEFFVIFQERDLVGYFGRERSDTAEFLTGFFVMPKYRNSKSMKTFWKIIQSKFGPTFFCGLFEKNLPAIEFIKKNKGEPMAKIKHHSEPGIIFRIKGHVCQ